MDEKEPEYICDHCGQLKVFDGIQMKQIEKRRYCIDCIKKLPLLLK
jgi:hypothetical protein